MTAKEQAERFYKDMFTIIRDRQDAKDCAIIMAKEMKRVATQVHPGLERFYDEAISHIKNNY